MMEGEITELDIARGWAIDCIELGGEGRGLGMFH